MDWGSFYSGAKRKSFVCVVLYDQRLTQINEGFIVFLLIFHQLANQLIDHFLIVPERKRIEILGFLRLARRLRFPPRDAVRLKRVVARWQVDGRLDVSLPFERVILALYFSLVGGGERVLRLIIGGTVFKGFHVNKMNM